MPAARDDLDVAAAPWHLECVAAARTVISLRLSGKLNAAGCAPLQSGLAEQLGGRVADIVLDLGGVTVISAAAARVFTSLADQLADTGHRLLLVTGSTEASRVLHAIHAADVLEVFPSVDSAVAALASRPDPGDPAEVARLRSRVHDLREKLRTRPLVAHAIGVLQGRYALRDADVADTLLRDMSQRHNIKVRDLAAAVIRAAPPASPDAAYWFPGRQRPQPPPVTFGPCPGHDRMAFLDLVLDAALSATRAPMGNVQLVELSDQGLTIQRHRGLPAAFLDQFTRVGAEGTACAAALRHRARVEVSDVASAPELSEQSRAALLAAGIHAVQSTPLRTTRGDCVGVVSTHHQETGWSPTSGARALLDLIGAEAGAWLHWHTTLTTLDALEHLHAAARHAASVS
jgi:anti-anti-sigma factor